MNSTIRHAVASDFKAVLALNASEVQHTSPMDMDRLKKLNWYASIHLVAEIDSSIVAFLLGMREGCSYQNDNYEWFSVRFPVFLYIDRIVVDAKVSGLNIGTMLYQEVFAHARSQQVPIITCEYNIVPLNIPSRIFHKKHGFQEIGTQWLDNETKQVSMQAIEI